jgi:DNA-binding response OmpR family regulator
MSATILIFSHDKATVASCATFLKHGGYAVLTAHRARQALLQAKTHHLDGVVIDMSSPPFNPRILCRQLRSCSLAPFIAIAFSHRSIDGTMERAAVVYKPVGARALLASVKGAIAAKPPHLLTQGDLTLDLEKRTLVRKNKTIKLMTKEFALLKILMQRAGQLVTRKTLMKEVWDTAYMGDTRTLDVYISWLRRKVEQDPSQPQHLLTVRGQGYRLQFGDA